MDQIREIVMSWQALDIIDIAGGDEYVVRSLLNLLEDDDPTVRLRALTALNELLKESDGRLRRTILREGFVRFVSLLDGPDGRVVARTIEVLRNLLSGSQIDEDKLLLLIDGSISVVRRGDTFLYVSFLDLLKSLELPPLSWRSRMKVEELLSKDDIHVKAIGMRLLLDSGSLEGRDGEVISGIIKLLKSENVLLLEKGFEFLQEVLTFHLLPSTMELLVGVLSVLKEVEGSAENVILRSRAASVRTELERTLFAYYNTRRDEALEVIKRLMERGDVEAGLNLALILGGTSLLLKLWEEDAENSDLPLIDLLKSSKPL